MGSLIKTGEYGIINGHIFKSIGFEDCDFNGTGILYVRSVDHKFLELNANESE